ncbi:MAG TPA: CPBP family intramembrane glutamic endopeptidase [Candidatus Polarisedimenticolaceae bacterium]|nr:CPBP family intramembrane glutamic endopeptidase [Candidatus Polarisedimenticolaceae bacterium]
MENHGSTNSIHIGRSRVVSGLELLLAGAIVIGHNVYHVVPNEVPILVVLCWISVRVRGGGWKDIGLESPRSWWKTVAYAILSAAAIVVLSDVVVGPIAESYLGAEHVSKAFQSPTHDLGWTLRSLGLVWTLAAFGEEIAYRGYLINRAAETGGRTRLAYGAALVVASVLFGYGHYYKGPAGVIASTVSGLVLGATYLLARRNLWVTILAHGFRDTFAIVAMLAGWGT